MHEYDPNAIDGKMTANPRVTATWGLDPPLASGAGDETSNPPGPCRVCRWSGRARPPPAGPRASSRRRLTYRSPRTPPARRPRATFPGRSWIAPSSSLPSCPWLPPCRSSPSRRDPAHAQRSGPTSEVVPPPTGPARSNAVPDSTSGTRPRADESPPRPAFPENHPPHDQGTVANSQHPAELRRIALRTPFVVFARTGDRSSPLRLDPRTRRQGRTRYRQALHSHPSPTPLGRQ